MDEWVKWVDGWVGDGRVMGRGIGSGWVERWIDGGWIVHVLPLFSLYS